MSGFRSSRDHELHQLRAVVGFEGSNDALIEWLHDGRGVGWEEDQGDVREAVHIEAHKDLFGGVRGMCGSVVKEQTMWRSSAFILALTCTSSSSHETRVETCRLR
jgi:hypothetical protein